MDVRWPKLLKKLEGQFSRPFFITWLKPTILTKEGEGLYTLLTPNLYSKQWLEKNAIEIIKQQIENDFEPVKHLRVVASAQTNLQTNNQVSLPLLELTDNRVKEKSSKTEAPNKEKSKEPPIGLNPNYTFETFVIGNNNRLAHAAAEVVSQKLGLAYNPLFIYGGVGLGKTHLMQAIGHATAANYHDKKIIYTSCEAFTSEFISALKNKEVDKFKHRYRQTDLLLIDDIQFLANKEGTQEEFFHTFNALHQSNRQIVITADRVPKDIPDLEERLRSRFGWGMVTDIQPPNFETRLAILQEKAQKMGLTISGEVLELIANEVASNVRELEGSLITLAGTANASNEIIDKQFALKTLRHLSSASTTNYNPKKIIDTVADYFRVDKLDLIAKSRAQEIVYPRQIAMYIIRKKTNLSLPQIGSLFGSRDHTTVMHAINKIKLLLHKQDNTEKEIKEIEKLCQK